MVMKFLSLAFLFLTVSLSITSAQAKGYDFYWSGNYSLEFNFQSSPDLAGGKDKNYGNHHLFLRPELILQDGLSIMGGLDVFNGAGSLPPSQRVGQFFGGNLSTPNNFASDVELPFLNRQIQKTREASLAEFYLKYSHVNAELRVGRLPLNFGYGVSYDAGYENFDHWYTNRDGFAYEIKFGALTFTPMVYRVSDSLSLGSDDIDEFGMQVDFEAKDTGLELSLLFLQRHIPGAANNSSFATGSANPSQYNLFFRRTYKDLNYGFEAVVRDGDIGTFSGSDVSNKGAAFAAEVNWTPKRWELKGRFGYASGNDLTDDNDYTGFGFHRNYNLGILMFNSPMGNASYDPTGTNPVGRRGSLGASFDPARSADTDRISNALYLSPSATYNFDDKWSLNSTLVFAWLSEKNVGAGGAEVSSFLGSEFDLTLGYSPKENVTWRTTIGLFQPGDAYEGVGGAFDTDGSIGFTSSLGIKF